MTQQADFNYNGKNYFISREISWKGNFYTEYTVEGTSAATADDDDFLVLSDGIDAPFEGSLSDLFDNMRS